MGTTGLNIGITIYTELAKLAERGERVVRVVLPQKLYRTWVSEGHSMNPLFSTLGVDVEPGEVRMPEFVRKRAA